MFFWGKAILGFQLLIVNGCVYLVNGNIVLIIVNY